MVFEFQEIGLDSLVSYSLEVGLNRHFTAALKGLLWPFHTQAFQLFVVTSATGGQTQRLKVGWLTKEESVFEYETKSKGFHFRRAPMVFIVTLREAFHKLGFQVTLRIFQRNVMEQQYKLELLCCYCSEIDNHNDFGAVISSLCFHALTLQGLQGKDYLCTS